MAQLRVVEEALRESGLKSKDIQGIGATYGPGLVGSLLHCIEFRKGDGVTWNVPFVGINHLEAHLHSIFLENPTAQLPMLSANFFGWAYQSVSFEEPD